MTDNERDEYLGVNPLAELLFDAHDLGIDISIVEDPEAHRNLISKLLDASRNHTDPAVRKSAIEYLQAVGDEHIEAVLEESAERDFSSDIRDLARLVLQKRRSEKLSGEDDGENIFPGPALGRKRLLMELLADDNPNVRYAALGFLSLMLGDDVEVALQEMLNDPDENVRMLASQGLELVKLRLRVEPTDDFYPSARAMHSSVVEGPLVSGESSFDSVMKACHSSDIESRDAGFSELLDRSPECDGLFFKDRLRNLLIQGLEDSSSHVRLICAKILTAGCDFIPSHVSDEALDELKKAFYSALDDDDEMVSEWAQLGLDTVKVWSCYNDPK